MATLTRKEREYRSRLVRRADHLEGRIAENAGKPFTSYDRGELHALRWVLDFIDNTEDLDD